MSQIEEPFYHPFQTPTRTTELFGSQLQQTPTNVLAKVILEHIQKVDLVSPATPPVRNFNKLLSMAKEEDRKKGLTPTQTIVERRPVVIPPSVEVWVHRHPESHILDILADQNETNAQEAALRVFLDAFHGFCGYIPYHMREQQGIHLSPSSTNCLGEQVAYTAEEKKIYTRSGAVENKMSSMPASLDEYRLSYLVGRFSHRQHLNHSHHRMTVKATAIYLERFSKRIVDKSRNDAWLGAFQMMTGYNSYSDAYNNATETRYFTDRGITAHPSVFISSPDRSLSAADLRHARQVSDSDYLHC